MADFRTPSGEACGRWRSSRARCRTQMLSGLMAGSEVPQGHCYTIQPMRRLLIVLMLAILPFQFSWAAAASYCRHETGGVATGHFGHHRHRLASASAQVAKDNKSKMLSGSDCDCSFCHLSAVIVPAPLLQVSSPLSGTALLYIEPSYLSHIPSGPERPDRGVAV